MNTIITSILLGLSLSMDAFSLCVFLGTMIPKNKAITLVINIGLFHLIMPIIGAILGYKLINILNYNGKYVLSLILIVLSLQIIISLFTKEKQIKFSIITILSLAFSVSIDSFSVGFGLSFEKNNIILSSIIFMICSSLFTGLGLYIGKFAAKKIGIYAKITGAILLLVFGIYHIFY